MNATMNATTRRHWRGSRWWARPRRSRPRAAYAVARACYLSRLSAAAPLFDFPDFALFRFVPSEARYIGGFARAYTLTPEHLRRAAEAFATESTKGTEL